MTFPFRQSGYAVRFAETPSDRDAYLGLRSQRFRNGLASDEDDFDNQALHLLVECSGRLTAYCRLTVFSGGIPSGESYTGLRYDLASLERLEVPKIELGRLCVVDGPSQSDSARLLWSAITRISDMHGAAMLFGCSSFSGAEVSRHAPALAYLSQRHLGPCHLRPGRISPEAMALPQVPPSPKGLPALMRSYLAMGGWVGDHAVLDHDLNTLHVFTGLETASVPATRARTLRARCI